MLAAAFARIARGFATSGIGPYVAGQIISQTDVETDAGGSIVSSGDPLKRDCMVQMDSVTDAMRADAGFVDGDVRLLILSDGIDGDVGTDDVVEVLTGSSAGRWSIEAVSRDPAGVGYDCRGRRG